MKRIPRVEDRVEDIRRRATLLAYFFEMQRTASLADYTVEPDLDVFVALQDYCTGIVMATKAIDAAEAGSDNPAAPDVFETDDDEKGGGNE
jgi:hypothetical protein